MSAKAPKARLSPGQLSDSLKQTQNLLRHILRSCAVRKRHDIRGSGKQAQEYMEHTQNLRGTGRGSVSRLYYGKLIFRGALFAAALALYISSGTAGQNIPLQDEPRSVLFGLFIIWLIFMIEMILRFFPSKHESMGCQKQFAASFRSTGLDSAPEPARTAKGTFIVAGSWVALNAAIGALYFLHVIDKMILILICLAFSVCDMICILFWCPFQALIMKNKCCVSCAIYNWDYAMMFTPLLFIPNFFTWSLFFLAAALLARWEYVYYHHPERFSESTNASLKCANCQDRLCAFRRKRVRNRAR